MKKTLFDGCLKFPKMYVYRVVIVSISKRQAKCHQIFGHTAVSTKFFVLPPQQHRCTKHCCNKLCVVHNRRKSPARNNSRRKLAQNVKRTFAPKRKPTNRSERVVYLADYSASEQGKMKRNPNHHRRKNNVKSSRVRNRA